MSRHRNVRNLDIDEVLEEDEYYDDYDDEALDEGDLNEDDRTQLEEGLVYVHSVVGDDIPVSDAEIKELLWDSYFDREQTVEEVLERIRKIRTEEEKQKKKEAKKAKDDDRKPRFRRHRKPKAPSDTIPTLTTAKQQASSPRSTPQQHKSLSSLSSIAKKSALADATKRPSSLQSLAQKSASQRGMTALQMLASRQQAPTTSSTTTSSTTTATTKPTSSLAALAQKSAKTKTTSLAHLATRSRPTTDAPAVKTNSLAALAYRAKTTRQSPAGTTEEYHKSEEEETKKTAEKDQKKEAKRAEKVEVEEEISTLPPDITGNSSQLTTPTLNDDTAIHNPLCAPPSAAANFLFMRTGTTLSKPSNDPMPFDSIGHAFYEAVKASSNSIHVFSFDVPSPDDIVMEAQTHRSGGQLRKS